MLAFLLVVAIAAGSPGAIASAQHGQPATLRGRVVDSKTGEAVSGVKVIVSGTGQNTATGDGGGFELRDLTPGEVELYITTIGYGLVKKSFALKEGENDAGQVALNQESSALTEQVTVSAGPFERVETNSPSEQALSKTELQSLSSLLLGDPVRAAQVLPGVAATDDFRSEFSLRGAGFDRVGVYIDGVLTDNFVHTINGNYVDSGSLAIINADTINGLTLMSGAFPAKFGNSTAGILGLETRDGNRVMPAGRFTASFSNVSGVADGPMGKGRGSWLLAARKSYLGYLVRRVGDENNISDTPVIDFSDVQGKVVYDLSPSHQLGVSAIYGAFDYDRNRPRDRVGLNNLFQADSRNLLVNAHWSYAPGSRLFVQARAFSVKTGYDNTNRDDAILDEGTRTQTGARGDISLLASPSHRVEAGFYARLLKEDRFSERYFFQPGPARNLLSYDRRATEQSYYAQETWVSARAGVSLTGGGRVDRSNLTGQTLLSPRASFAFAPGDQWRVRLAYGRHYQFPAFDRLYGRLGNAGLKAERATHYNASVERFLGSRTRVLVEFYAREDRDLLFSLYEPRMEGPVPTFTEFPYSNSLRGYGRGVELTLQRRSANRLSGWISYSYSKTRLADAQTGLSFASDYDQRHTLNAYAGYRFRGALSLSGLWRYGSGMTIPGFFEEAGGERFLASERNLLRLPIYSRIDLRLSKAFLFDKWKLTLYGEVLNALNRENLRFTGLDGVGPRRAAFLSLDKLLPIFPSAGAAIEF